MLGSHKIKIEDEGPKSIRLSGPIGTITVGDDAIDRKLAEKFPAEEAQGRNLEVTIVDTEGAR